MASLTRWNPWSDLFSLHDQMDRLFDEAFGSVAPAGTGGGETVLTLPIDVRQTDQAFVIEASVPGFTPDDVEVTLDGNVLTIKGNRRQDTEDRQQGWIRRERRTASVYRQVALPNEVRSEEITASFHNGVLTLTVPRAQKAHPKRIPVNAGAPQQPKVIDAPGSQQS